MTFAPEQLRAMLLEVLSDPETRKHLLRHLPPVFPVQGGTGCTSVTASSNTAGKLTKWSATSCDLADSVVSESSGNVGIGATSPNYPLDVGNSNAATIYININAAAAYQTGLQFMSAGTARSIIYRPASSNDLRVFSTTAGDMMSFQNSTGNVGIWTTSPNYPLDVGNSNAATIYININAAAAYQTGLQFMSAGTAKSIIYRPASSNDLRVFSTTAGDIMSFQNSTGNVGIGTTSPTEKLDVAGNILSQGLNKIVFLKPNGSTDGTQINTAISALPSNGGIIYLMPGEWSINTTINLNKSGVKLRGYGGAQPSSATPLTKLLWAGSSGGTIIEASAEASATITGASNATPIQITTSAAHPYITGDTVVIEGVAGNTAANNVWTITKVDATQFTLNGSTGNGNYAGGGTVYGGHPILDVEISDLEIDGNAGSAGIGLNLDGVQNSRFKNLSIHNINLSSGVGLRLFVTAPDGLNWSVFERISISNCWRGMVLDSRRTQYLGNPAHNTFVNVNVQGFGTTGTQPAGVWLGDCDNNAFYDLITGSANQGPSYPNSGVVINDPYYARANYFYHLQAGGGGLKIYTNLHHTTSAKNLIFGYDQENGSDANERNPSTDNPGTYPPENFLAWSDSGGVMHSFPIQAAADVPSLDASKITTGVFSASRIPNLDASKITTGILDTARIPDLDASKIATGVLPLARGGTGVAATGILDCQNGQKKVKFGISQLSNGEATVDTGLTSVDHFIAFLVFGGAPPEYLGRDNPSGGSVTVYSSDNTSDRYFDWMAVGT